MHTFKVIYRDNNCPPEKVAFIRASSQGAVAYEMRMQYGQNAFIVKIEQID